MRAGADLEKRQRDVLVVVVRQYVSSGVPVGSKVVAEHLPEPLSSATIRTCMADLEASGLLSQPHVSAGRIPTDKAYRFYVDQVAGSSRLARATEKFIQDALEGEVFLPEHPMGRLWGKASLVLSEVSRNVGLVLGPASGEKLLEHLKFVKLPERRILAMIASKPDLLENTVVRMEDDFSQEELDRAAEFVNQEFRGWSMKAIRLEVFKRVEEMKAVCDRVVTHVAALFTSGAMSGEETGTLFVNGATKILDQPEFTDVQKTRDLLATLEEKAKLVRILNACADSPSQGVQIVIGRENTESKMQGCTLVMAPFRYRNRALGALGVVGPTRMEYDLAITAVDYVAQLCSRLLSAT